MLCGPTALYILMLKGICRDAMWSYSFVHPDVEGICRDAMWSYSFVHPDVEGYI